MSGRAGKDGPEDVDAAFAEIVAELEREGVAVKWPDETPDGPKQTPTQPKPDPEPAAQTPTTVADEEAVPDDEAHYVPPDPPPLPTLRPATIGALSLIIVGLVLLVSTTLFSLPPQLTTPFALVAVSAGIGWLVLRMRQGPPPGSGWDDGAQL